MTYIEAKINEFENLNKFCGGNNISETKNPLVDKRPFLMKRVATGDFICLKVFR